MMLSCVGSLRQMFRISTEKTETQIMLPVDTSTETTDRAFLADVQLLLSETHKNIREFNDLLTHKIRPQSKSQKPEYKILRYFVCNRQRIKLFQKRNFFLLFIDPRILLREWNSAKKEPLIDAQCISTNTKTCSK